MYVFVCVYVCFYCFNIYLMFRGTLVVTLLNVTVVLAGLFCVLDGKGAGDFLILYYCLV